MLVLGGFDSLRQKEWAQWVQSMAVLQGLWLPYLELFDELPLLGRVMLCLLSEVVQIAFVLVQDSLGGLVQVMAHAWRYRRRQGLHYTPTVTRVLSRRQASAYSC